MVRSVVRVDLPADSELLRGLEPKQIDVLRAAARKGRFPANSVITYQSEPAEQLFLLLTGRVRFFYVTDDGNKLILLWVTPGKTFGAAALALPPSTYLVSTEAVRDSTVLVWDGPSIRELGKRFPQLMMNAYLTAMDYPANNASTFFLCLCAWAKAGVSARARARLLRRLSAPCLCSAARSGSHERPSV